jgi:hypothetical protein
MCRLARAAQVIRGYVGDRSAKPVADGASPFDVLGTGYQRPFELATLRLQNMLGILPRCARHPCRAGKPCFPTSGRSSWQRCACRTCSASAVSATLVGLG